MGLDTAEPVLSVEKIFRIHVPDEAAAQLDTVGNLHEFIVASLVEPERKNTKPEIIFDPLRSITCA